MSARTKLRSWWKALASRSELESEMEAELRFHCESYADDLVRGGMPREEALRRARIELGTVASQKEDCRRSLGLRAWDDLTSDLRYALRQLKSAPAFTATVVLVLALGIGANAAMFSIVDATLLRWLPYHRPNELVSLYLADETGSPSWAYYQDLVQWQSHSHGLESMAYYTRGEGFLETKTGQEPVSAQRVSANLFSVLGVQAALGRTFLPDEQTSSTKAAIVSDAVWHAMLQADPEAVGKQVRLNDQPYTVVGVMPAHFVFPANDNAPQVWVPAELTPVHWKPISDYYAPKYEAIGRMQKGSSRASLSAELSGLESRLVADYPQAMREERPLTRVDVTPYRETLVAHVRPALLALIAAVMVIWLIACGNVANLMLARGMARQREIAVRRALGASRWRIVRQLFTESMALSALGAAAGLGLAQLTLRIFARTLSTRVNLPEHLSPNPSVLSALLILSFLSALLFGLLPAWLAARTPLEHSLRQGTVQSGAGRLRHHLQQAMVMAEIGLSLVLLISCGLLLRTVFALGHVPLGFRTDHVLMVQPKLPRFKYRNIDANQTVYQPLLQRIQQMPGVRSAAITTLVPLDKGGFAPILSLYVHAEKSSVPMKINVLIKAVGPELQDVLGFHMVRGRFFNQQDTPDSELVAVANRAFAQRYLPAGDVMENFMIGPDGERKAKIIGVVDDLHQESIDQPSFPEIDMLATQLGPTHSYYPATLLINVQIAIRTQTAPEQMIPALRRAMLELNPDLQASTLETMDQVVEDSMGSQLLAAHLLELFGAVAVLIALAGLYGLLTYLVAQRKPELGIRIALGAQRRDIMAILLGQAGRMLLAGAVIGSLLAYASMRLLAEFLYGVKPHDAETMVAVTALLLLFGLMTALIPARMAAKVDPMEAIRSE
ncbi:MAG TPA: ABC transporter permease [Candidatus Angelobacter sp.]|nr:ABC transporter permease [Candidatus Angelobacter sp.]